MTESGLGLKKLLVVSSTYPRWASDTEPSFVHELSRRLTSSFEVHVICPHAKNSTVYELLHGVHVHRFRYAPNYMESLVNGGGMIANIKSRPLKAILLIPFLLGMGIAIYHSLKKIKPDVVHAHWIIPQGFVLAVVSLFIKLPPVLLTSHGGDLFSLNGNLFRWIKRWSLKKVSRVSVVSYAMCEKVFKLGFPVKNVSVVPMGVDFESLYFPDEKLKRIPFRILFVGRLVEKKGLIYLVKALKIVKEQFPQAHLCIVGGGPAESIIKAEILRLKLMDSVEWLGALPQASLPNHYRQASLFVAPFVVASSGDQEGLGLVALEAIACECPVILGDVEAVREFYSKEDISVELVNSKDVEALAFAINNAFSNMDYLLEKAKETRNLYIKRIGWSVISERYLAELMELNSTLS